MDFVQATEYSTEFDSKSFLQTFHSSVEGSSVQGLARFRLRQRHNFFLQYSCKWDRNTAKMLEFGGGPVISDLISAAPHVQEIVHAAHTEDERKEIQLWKNEMVGAHDWKHAFKHVVSELESKAGDDAWQERESLLRSRLKVTSCNITHDHPIGPTEEGMLFSIICTSLCLEVTCKTYAEYKMAIKKLAKLLKLGGYLVMLVVEGETFYVVGRRKWSVLTLTLAQVKEALEEAGFVLLMVERDPATMQHIQNPTVSDFKACLFLAAYKVNYM